MVNLRLSFFEVFNSNFHILKVQRHLSLKITICYGKTLFLCIPKYFEIQNSTFQEKANTKVYALEDSLGVHGVWENNHSGLTRIKIVFQGFDNFGSNPLYCTFSLKLYLICHLLITFVNSLDPDQAQHSFQA